MTFKTTAGRFIPVAVLGLSLVATVPMVYAQGAGGGAAGAGGMGNANVGAPTRGNGPAGNSGASATSPSTLGGSVSGSVSDPAVPGSTAGDSAVRSPTDDPRGLTANPNDRNDLNNSDSNTTSDGSVPPSAR